MQDPVPLILLWFVVASLLCFALMFWDKRAAQGDGWRVPERRLLMWAFLGGGVGGVIAQRRFRHKTRKEPFRSLLRASVAFNALTFVALLVPSGRAWAWTLLESFLSFF
ncbi:MAG: DUF1294 domain-containing protein [Paracoccaceae bacterium]